MRPVATRGEMSKRKIQAQRKFAQGAIIPTTPNNVVVRNDIGILNVKEDQNIIHSNLSAKSLLDIVSFQSIHAHKKPVVLLERLENKPPQVPKPMCLRDRNNTITKKVLPTKLTKKPVVVKKPLVTKVIRQKRASKTVSTDDDETPLKFLKKDSNQRQASLPNRPKTRTYAESLASQSSTIINKKKKKGNHLKNNARAVNPNAIVLLARKKSLPKPEASKSVQPNNTVKKVHNSKTGNHLKNNAQAVKPNAIVLMTRKKSHAKPETSKSVQQSNSVKKVPNTKTVSNVKRVQREETTSEKVKEKPREKKLPDDKIVNGETKDDSSDSSDVGSDFKLVYNESESGGNGEQKISSGNSGTLIPDDNIPNHDKKKPHKTTEVTTAIVHVNSGVEDIKTESSRKESGPGISGALLKKPNEKSSKQELPKKTTDASTSTDHAEKSLQDVKPDLDTIRPAEKEDEPKTGQFYGNTGIRTWMDSARPHCETENEPESTKKPCDDVYQFDPEIENRPYSKFERNKKPEGRVSYLDILPKSNPFIVQMTPEKSTTTNNIIMRAKIVDRNEALNNNHDNVERNDNLEQLLNTLSRNNSQIAPEINPEIVCIDDSQSASDDDVQIVEVASTSKAVPDSGAAPPAGRLLGQQQTKVPPAVTSTLTPAPAIAVQLPGNVTQHTDRLNQPSVSNATKDTRQTRFKPRPSNKNSNIVDAPVFHPTEEEFMDPISFFEKAMTIAAKFGLCKVVSPPSFKPTCKQIDVNFRVINQYIARMYNRWGPAAREMGTIKAYLYSQNVIFTRPPLHEGLELNLPKLYRLVQRHGGLKQVIEKKRWSRVAEEMRCTKLHNSDRLLDKLYVKYLLPYDTLSNLERQQTTAAVEKCWNQKNQKLLEWALNPLHRQKKLLGESDSSEDEPEPDPQVASALADAEDCVVQGRSMNLATFEKVAKTAIDTFFPTPPRSPADVEDMYWRTMLLGSEHICVNSASIDTGDAGYGFTKDRDEPFGSHPWNLKMFSENSGNVLRSLNAVLGVTVPTLHLGMVFSTSCWHRDPHGLPWVEYMHSGPCKIWYGIPNEQSSNFRKAVETLCPSSCQTKSIWLPSDVTMIPPNLLREHNVSLSRVEQHPGEFVIVFPKAYSCSISTGYTQSESVYFATSSWLNSVHQVFQELRDSCEPTTFSLEQLLIALAKDTRAPLGLLPQVHSSLSTIITEELNNRRQLVDRGLQYQRVANYPPTKRSGAAWNVRDLDECEICRATLYLSKVTGLTGRQSSVCLQHALRLLDTPRHSAAEPAHLELLVAYTDHELMGIIVTVQDRLFK